VVAALGEVGALLTEESYEHKYPYDWRTKKPTIFRYACPACPPQNPSLFDERLKQP
jgi:hypothetical protein